MTVSMVSKLSFNLLSTPGKARPKLILFVIGLLPTSKGLMLTPIHATDSHGIEESLQTKLNYTSSYFIYTRV